MKAFDTQAIKHAAGWKPQTKRARVTMGVVGVLIVCSAFVAGIIGAIVGAVVAYFALVIPTQRWEERELAATANPADEPPTI
jgi:hypothetical protein